MLCLLSEREIVRKVSLTAVSSANKKLIDAIEKWRTWYLSGEPVKYTFLGGVNFDTRIDRSIETLPVLVVIGVAKTGRKRVLEVQANDKEKAPTYRKCSKI